MSQLRALLTVQAQSAWNRSLRESGVVGPVATAGVYALALAVLALPGGMCLEAGWDLGRRIAAGDHGEAIRLVTALEALFTVAFAVCGAFRHRIAFAHRDLGAYPIRPLTFLAAEIPAGAFEVFPLLASAGILCSHLGAALALPAASPLVALLALQAAVFMLLLQHLLGSCKRLLQKRPLPALLVGGALAAALVVPLVARGGDPRPAIGAAAVRLIAALPSSQGWAGLADLLAGRLGAAAGRWACMAAVTALLLGLTARVHAREMRMESTPTLRRKGEPRPLSFRWPPLGIARLHQKQVLATRQGTTQLAVSAIMGACAVVTLWAVRDVAGRGEELPEALASTLAATSRLPLLEIVLFVLLWTAAETWTNHFGWDAGGLRVLLTAPLAIPVLLAGKLLGTLELVGAHLALGAVPLLLVYRPGLHEAVTALAAVAWAAVAANLGGLVMAIRFPRSQTGAVATATPVYLGWVPGVLMLVLAQATWVVHRVAGAVGPWAPPLVFLLLLAAAVYGSHRALPALARFFLANQERLLGT